MLPYLPAPLDTITVTTTTTTNTYSKDPFYFSVDNPRSQEGLSVAGGTNTKKNMQKKKCWRNHETSTKKGTEGAKARSFVIQAKLELFLGTEGVISRKA